MVKTGSMDFIFDRKAIFEIDPGKRNLEELELELIDFGLDEIEQEEGKTILTVPFNEFGNMQKGLEGLGITVISAEKERFANVFKEGLTEEQIVEVNKLIDALEDDDDVQSVYHNMK